MLSLGLYLIHVIPCLLADLCDLLVYSINTTNPGTDLNQTKRESTTPQPSLRMNVGSRLIQFESRWLFTWTGTY